jgi:hypothetical protein
MKITRSDNRALIILDFPYLIGILGYPLAAFLFVQSVACFAGQGIRSEQGWATALGTFLAFTVSTVFTKRSEFHFDFIARELRWKRRGLFTNQVGAVPFDQIRSAAIETNTDGEGSDTTRPVLKTASGVLGITDASSSNTARHRQICDAINRALGVSRDTAKEIETQILEYALAGKKMEAIKLARSRYGYDLGQAKEFVEGLSKT